MASAQHWFRPSVSASRRLIRPPGRRPLTLFLTGIVCVTALRLLFATAPDILLANIDASVSPRDDFFQYANGTWLKQHPIPDDQMRWGIGNVASDALYSQLRRLSDEAACRARDVAYVAGERHDVLIRDRRARDGPAGLPGPAAGHRRAGPAR